MAELNEELAAARVLGDQIAKVGEAVEKWQNEKRELEAKLAGFESFQRLVLEQPDEVILELIKDVKQQLKEQCR